MEYRIAIKEAFSATDIKPEFPFAGLPIGKAMQAAKVAIEAMANAAMVPDAQEAFTAFLQGHQVAAEGDIVRPEVQAHTRRLQGRPARVVRLG